MNSATSTVAIAAGIDWLTSPAAAPWLQLAGQWSDGPLSLMTRLRAELPAERARLVAEQAELRRRAADKFVHAERMFFTARGLEQASDEVVARYKARRFPPGRRVADLCCGVGGDLMGLARRGPVIGVERDAATAALATANLRALSDWTVPDVEAGYENTAQVAVADAADFRVGEFAGWHIDPDRRPHGRRTTRVALHEPGPDVIAALLDETPSGAIKLAPAAEFRPAFPMDCVGAPIRWDGAELEWISRQRQCRQLVAWFGALAEHPGRRRATLLAGDLHARPADLVVASFVGSPGGVVPIADKLGRFVCEPDAAVLAADLCGALAAEYRLRAMAPNVAYLTADEPGDSPLLSLFEVQDVMPYRVKVVKEWLRARRAGRLEVKKRGVTLDPNKVQIELKVPGEEQATLLLCRSAGKIMAILARRAG